MDKRQALRHGVARMDLPPKRVEEFLHQRVPLSRTLDCQVLESTHRHIVLSIPKFQNTVRDDDFSDVAALSLCKLACWTFLQVSLQRLDYKPLISLDRSTWAKHREIDSNADAISASCQLPAEKEWQQFLRMLSRKGRASANLAAALSDNLGETATLSCHYVVRDLDPT